MKARGERIVIFGDSLTHPGSDNGPTQSIVAQDSNRPSSAPGDLLGSLLLEQGAEAVMLDARVGRSANNYWNREPTQELMGVISSFKPTKAVVMLGTNDIGLNLATDKIAMEAIRDTLKAAGAEVWAIGPMTYVGNGSNLNAGAQAVFEMMSEVFGNKLIDARPLASQANRAGDGVHFSQGSAKETAQALAEALLAKNPVAPWKWALGGLSLVAGLILFWRLARRGKSLNGLGRLALPPAPGADIVAIANDAFRLGDEAQGFKILDELSKADRKKLDVINARAGTIHNEKDFDPSDVIGSADTVDEAVTEVSEELDSYKEDWIEQNAEDIRSEGGVPELAWNYFRDNAVAVTRREAKEYFDARREEEENSAAEGSGYDGAAEEIEEEEIDEADAAWQANLDQRERVYPEVVLRDLIANPEPGSMEVAEDYAREQGIKISSVSAMAHGGHAEGRHGNFLLRKRPAPDDPLYEVSWTVGTNWNDKNPKYQVNVAFGRVGWGASQQGFVVKTDHEVQGSNEYARKAAIADAWAVAKAVKALPLDSDYETVKATVTAALDRDNSDPSDELFGTARYEFARETRT